MPIRYTKDENAYLRREVASFRKKVKRLQRKGVSQGLLPMNVKVSDLKRTYTNWQDLEAKLEQMRNFSSVGTVFQTQKGLFGTETLFQYKQQEIDEGLAIAKMRRESLRKAKHRSAVKTQSLRNLSRKIQKMDVNVRDIDFKLLQKINQNSLTLEEYTEKQETFYESFFQMLFQSAQYSGANEQIIQDIRTQLYKLTPEELSELLDKEDTVSDLMAQYEVAKKNKWVEDEHTKADFRVKLNNLRRQLPRILEEYGVNDAKV